MNYSLFTGSAPYTINDRDGYEKTLFTIGVTIKFNEDHSVFAWEQRGTFAASNLDETSAHFTGKWSISDDELITFSLKRLKEAETVQLGLPDDEDARDYYYYPESAEVSDLREMEYRGLLSGNKLHLVNVALSSAYILETRDASDTFLPRLTDNLQINTSAPWCSFQVQQQPSESANNKYLVLRFHSPDLDDIMNDPASQTVFAWEFSSPLKNDYYQLSPPALTGQWKEGKSGVYSFSLTPNTESSNPEETEIWQSGNYRATYENNELNIHQAGNEQADPEATNYDYTLAAVTPDTVFLSPSNDESSWEEQHMRDNIERYRFSIWSLIPEITPSHTDMRYIIVFVILVMTGMAWIMD